MKLTKSDAKYFVDLVFKGIECWIEAGQFVATKIDENPNFVDEVCREFPQLSPEYVIRFEQVGRKKLHPQLILSSAPGARRLISLPYSLQEKHITEPVDVVIKTDAGWETLKIDIRNLTKDQADQVFERDSIRSEAAQRAFIEDRAAKRVAPSTNADLPYRIVKNKLVVMEPCTFSASELARILSQATA
jgi:hypothetical protein